MDIGDAHGLGAQVSLVLFGVDVLPPALWQVHCAMCGRVAEDGGHQEMISHQELVMDLLGDGVLRVAPPQRSENWCIVVLCPLFFHVAQDVLAERHQPVHVPGDLPALQQRQVGQLEGWEENGQLQPALKQLHVQLWLRLQGGAVSHNQGVATHAQIQGPGNHGVETLSIFNLVDVCAQGHKHRLADKACGLL